MGGAFPQKRYFRIGEVSRLTDLEPHVIRYWEKEFHRLKPLRADSRQRLYTQEDVRLILEIRRLLHEERYTIAGARKRLAEPGGSPASGPGSGLEPAPLPAFPALPEPVPRAGTQPELPLFPDEPPPQPAPGQGSGEQDLLGTIKQELGRIIRILS